IRPQHIDRAAPGRTGDVRSQIDLVQPTGARTYVTFAIGADPVMAELDAHDAGKPGDELQADFDLDHFILIAPESGKVLGSGRGNEYFALCFNSSSRRKPGPIKFFQCDQRRPYCAYPGDPGFRRDDRSGRGGALAETIMSDREPSHAVRLYGTEEEVAPPQVVKAGALSVEFEAGNLRYIRYAGIEMIRAVSFIVRDRNWATYTPALSNLLIEEAGDGFTITYDAETKDKDQSFRYAARISGSAKGTIEFAAEGVVVTDFVTNRTGFVVLHPIAGVAGRPAVVETADGKRLDS